MDYTSTDDAHGIMCHGTREEMIDWCAWNDRNGVFRDEDCEAEGLPLLDERSAQLVMLQFLLPPCEQDANGDWHSGASVRLYGYPGVFLVDHYDVDDLKDSQFVLVPVRRSTGSVLFNVPITSIVEIDGEPVSLRSRPIAPPASDYPHVLKYDFRD